MMKLYEINEAILNCVDPETGEADIEKLDELMLIREAKIENLALWVKNLRAEAEAIKAEEDIIMAEAKALAQRRQAKERKADGIRKYLEKVLEGQKFETSRVLCSFRKSQKVEITNLDKIPDDYLRYSAPTPDKVAITAAIKDGISIEGAELVDSVTMSIK
jgi:hypothetical protein